MESAQKRGLKVIPVTGRPGGWVDHITRMWPVDGVIGENGGLWFYMADGKLQRRFLQDEPTRRANRARLDALAATILQAVPGAALASDQPYRELDLAIDFCEDVPPLPDTDIDQIVRIFQDHGAHCKVSSIHVNGWYGDFDKLTGFSRLTADLGEPDDPDLWAFVGDSANDAPMFAHFPISVGVANVDRFLPRIPTWPRYRTVCAGGYGFAEFTSWVLGWRG